MHPFKICSRFTRRVLGFTCCWRSQQYAACRCRYFAIPELTHFFVGVFFFLPKVVLELSGDSSALVIMQVLMARMAAAKSGSESRLISAQYVGIAQAVHREFKQQSSLLSGTTVCALPCVLSSSETTNFDSYSCFLNLSGLHCQTASMQAAGLVLSHFPCTGRGACGCHSCPREASYRRVDSLNQSKITFF
jgi:hypothetical protein